MSLAVILINWWLKSPIINNKKNKLRCAAQKYSYIYSSNIIYHPARHKANANYRNSMSD